jgi:hypothetical protein
LLGRTEITMDSLQSARVSLNRQRCSTQVLPLRFLYTDVLQIAKISERSSIPMRSNCLHLRQVIPDGFGAAADARVIPCEGVGYFREV